MGGNALNVNAVNCNGGEGTEYELTFSPGLDESMTYDLEFIYNYADECDNEFTLKLAGVLW